MGGYRALAAVKRTARLIVLAALGILAVALRCGPGCAQSVAPVQDELIRQYVEAFRPHGMVAVLISLGQAPGDVVDKLGEEFVYRRNECFNGLTVREDSGRLPSFDLGASAALRLGLGLDKIGSADLHALGERQVILRFEDVTVQTVSQGALRQAINRQACPDIARLIDKDPDALKDGTLLVGEVFRARSVVRVSRDQGAGGQASAGGLLSRIAARFGLKIKAEGDASADSAQSVEISNKEPLPVAFRPAFIRLDPTQRGYRSTEGRQNAPSIVPFNPDSEDDRLVLDGLIARQLPSAAIR